ncbi:MAG TPA: MBL fold metallo-hydrolase [Limnochordia bacterium]|nr:MBL fold metallo-hydrolase [Limnochordia bacterium]
MQVSLFSVNAFGVNCYVVHHQGEAVIVDPGGPSKEVLDFLEREGLEVLAIINTHGHADHIAGNSWFVEKTGAPLFIHEGDAEYLRDPRLHLGPEIRLEVPDSQADRLLQDGDLISVGDESLTIMHTPGHSGGGIALVGSGFVLSGDTLFKESVGRWDFPASDERELQRSLLRLAQLAPETTLYPGHGPSSTIFHELQHNPFLTSIKDVE